MVVVRKYIRKGKVVRKHYRRGKPGKLMKRRYAPTGVLQDPKTGRLFGRYKP